MLFKIPKKMLLCSIGLVATSLLFSRFAIAQQNDHQTTISTARAASLELHVSNDKTRAKTSSLTVDGKIIKFELTENTRLTEKLTKKATHIEFKLLKGKILGNKNSWARFTDVDGVLTGAYYDGNELYFIDNKKNIEHSLQNFVPTKSNDSLVIYSASNISHKGTCASHEHTGASTFNYQNYSQQLSQMTASVAGSQIDIEMVADVEYAQKRGVNADIDMLKELNIVDGIFSEQVGIHLVANDVKVLTNNNGLTSTKPNDLLVQFRNSQPLNTTRGIRHLLTGKNLDGNVVGIAYIGEICGTFASGVTQLTNPNTALIMAHELGHNFGSPHDTDSKEACASASNRFLMNPQINGSNQFSACSIAIMKQEVERASCVVAVMDVPPTIDSIPLPNANVNIEYQYQIDARGSKPMTASLDIYPSGMTISSTNLITWTPTQAQVGDVNIQVTLQNAAGQDTQFFEINVFETPPQSDVINFEEQTINAYGKHQDTIGDVDILNNGASLSLEGNRWKSIDFDYELTADTFIEFDFTSTNEGEIHGIGFDDNDSLSASRTIQLLGTQQYGILDFNYTASGESQHFIIPIGQYYTGKMNRLFFAMDNDVRSPNSNSIFSNVNVYEAGASPIDNNPPLNLNDYELSSYAGAAQNKSGTVLIVDDGATLEMIGNRWHKMAIDTIVESSTVLELEFKSSAKGDIHGIGFTNSNNVSDTQTFQLYGTQPWGNESVSYQGNGEYQKLRIPVGQYYTGSFKYLFFVMDHDVSSPNGESYFKNIVIK